MFGIQIDNKFLDLLPRTALNFELRNPAYFGAADSDVIQESFMFTISVPLTDNNRRLLLNPNRIDNAAFFLAERACSVWCQGIDIFRGLLTVRSATASNVEIFVKVNTISILKNLALEQLNHDTIDLSVIPDKIAWLSGSCTSPEYRDFICFPVWNPGFWGEENTNQFADSTYQNMWKPSSNRISTLAIEGRSAVTPFLKVTYLLRKMAQTTGFILGNYWQTNRELELLCNYNNRSIITWNETGTAYNWDNLIEYKNHVSKTKSSDYLKHLARLFNLGVYVNFFDNTMDIVPNNTLLEQSPRFDWTHKVLSNYTKSEEVDFPSKLSFAQSPSALPDISQLNRYSTGISSVNSPEGIYSNSGGRYYYHQPDAVQPKRITVEMDNLVIIPNSVNDNIFESPLQTLPNARVFMNGFGPVTAPAINQKGHFKIGNTQESEASFDDRLIFYRGMADFSNGATSPIGGSFYPLAAAEDSTVVAKPIKTGWDSAAIPANQIPIQYQPKDCQYTLNWNTEKGLWGRWWSAWHTMLQNKRDVKMTVGLSTKEIRSLSFQHKIRIENREFLIKRLRVTLTESGAAPTEVELITV